MTAIPTEFRCLPSGRWEGAPPFVAQMTYITEEELTREMEILLKDLAPNIIDLHTALDAEDSKPHVRKNDEADAAQEKLVAMFPELKIEDMAKMVVWYEGEDEPRFNVRQAMREVVGPMIKGIGDLSWVLQRRFRRGPRGSFRI